MAVGITMRHAIQDNYVTLHTRDSSAIWISTSSIASSKTTEPQFAYGFVAELFFTTNAGVARPLSARRCPHRLFGSIGVFDRDTATCGRREKGLPRRNQKHVNTCTSSTRLSRESSGRSPVTLANTVRRGKAHLRSTVDYEKTPNDNYVCDKAGEGATSPVGLAVGDQLWHRVLTSGGRAAGMGDGRGLPR
jgi:hypothetical protein